MKRPLVITVLTFLAFIDGLLASLDALRLFGIIPTVILGPFEFFGIDTILRVALGIGVGILAIIWFWIANQLRLLNTSGWLYLIILAGIYILIDLVAVAGGTSFQYILPSFFISIIVLAMAMMPMTRRSFDV